LFTFTCYLLLEIAPPVFFVGAKKSIITGETPLHLFVKSVFFEIDFEKKLQYNAASLLKAGSIIPKHLTSSSE